MSRSIDAATITALEQGVVRWLVLVKIEFDGGTIAFNSTLGDFDYDGQTYTGFGALGSVSRLEEGSELDPQSFTISLSGINPAVLSAVLNEDYLNRPAICHIAPLDDDNQIIGTPILYFDAKVDSVSASFGNTASISITARDKLADWNRPRIERYTDQDQQARYPGDKGFEFVTSIASKEIIWPARAWFEKEANR